MNCACCSSISSSRTLMMQAAVLRPRHLPMWSLGLAMADAAKPSRGTAHIEDYRRDAKLPERGHYLIRNATVALTMDAKLGDLSGCDIHIRDGEIIAVGQHLQAAGAEIIDASRMIVMPGFVDTHWHLWNSIFRGIVFLYGPDLGYFPLKLRL